MVLLLYNIPGKLSSMWTRMRTRPCGFVLLRPFVWHALCGLAGLSDMPPLAVSQSYKSYTKFPTCPDYQNMKFPHISYTYLAEDRVEFHENEQNE